MTGSGKAVGGIILKTTAGIIGPIAFSMKGLEREMTKSKQPVAHIRHTNKMRARTEKMELSASERAEVQKRVLERWSAGYKKWRKEREEELRKQQKRRYPQKIMNGDAKQPEENNVAT